MDSEMIERVAKVLWEKHNVGPWRNKLAGDLTSEYLYLARAVIKAMREPTEKMLNISFDVEVGDGGSLFIQKDDMVDLYQAMIDAVIND